MRVIIPTLPPTKSSFIANVNILAGRLKLLVQLNEKFSEEDIEVLIKLYELGIQILIDDLNRAENSSLNIVAENIEHIIDLPELLSVLDEEIVEALRNLQSLLEYVQGLANELKTLSIAVEHAPEGEIASGTYNPDTGMLTLRVPIGPQGTFNASISDSLTSPDSGVAASSKSVFTLNNLVTALNTHLAKVEDKADTAQSTANNRVLRSGDVMTGPLIVEGVDVVGDVENSPDTNMRRDSAGRVQVTSPMRANDAVNRQWVESFVSNALESYSVGTGGGIGGSLLSIELVISSLVKTGYLSLCRNNGVLNATVETGYPDAYEEIRRRRLLGDTTILTMSEWQNVLTGNGGLCCGYFAIDTVSQTFRVPFLQSMYLRGHGGSLPIGGYLPDTLGPHEHQIWFSNWQTGGGSGGAGTGARERHWNNTRDFGPGIGTETRPRTIVVDYQMKMREG